jgi:predicted metal-dependent hydrolase
MLLETNYTITRSKRRTLAIQIGREGQVVVKAPHKLSEAKIQQFIQQKTPGYTKPSPKFRSKDLKSKPKKTSFKLEK